MNKRYKITVEDSKDGRVDIIEADNAIINFKGEMHDIRGAYSNYVYLESKDLGFNSLTEKMIELSKMYETYLALIVEILSDELTQYPDFKEHCIRAFIHIDKTFMEEKLKMLKIKDGLEGELV